MQLEREAAARQRGGGRPHTLTFCHELLEDSRLRAYGVALSTATAARKAVTLRLSSDFAVSLLLGGNMIRRVWCAHAILRYSILHSYSERKRVESTRYKYSEAERAPST